MKKVALFIGMLLFLSLILTACGGADIAPDTGKDATPANSYKNAATVEDELQAITTQFSSRSYEPITVQVGVPVQWTIIMDENDLNSCNNAISIPEYDIAQNLNIGKTVVEFTPVATGKIPYSCWMGMIRSSITVVDDLANTATPPASTTERITTLAVAAPQEVLPLSTGEGIVEIAQVNGEEADVAIAVQTYGYVPAVVIVQKGVPTNFVFSLEAPSCASDIVFPQLTKYVDLSENNTVSILPTGDFEVQCTMGMYGFMVKAVEDINAPEVAELAKSIEANPAQYGFAGNGCGMMNGTAGGGCCGAE